MAPAQTPLPPLPQTKTAASPAAAFVYSITSSQARQHLLRLALLRGIAFAEDFDEDIPGAVIVTHVDVSLGQIELGRHFVGAAEEVEIRLIVGTGPRVLSGASRLHQAVGPGTKNRNKDGVGK